MDVSYFGGETGKSINVGATYGDVNKDYSAKLMELFRAEGDIDVIYVGEKTGLVGVEGAEKYKGHDDHMHVQYKDPDGIPPAN